jgi:hypothetical protein
MSILRSAVIVALALAAVGLASGVQAQAQSYVRVPHSAGTVYVPIDGNGLPTIGTPAPVENGRPTVPPAPSAPAAPSGAIASLGYLRLEIDPPSASVAVDGYPVGTAGELRAGRLLGLVPGPHRIEADLPGHRTLHLGVTIVAGRTRVLRAGLEALDEATIESGDAVRSGYVVVPKGMATR